MTQDPGDAGSDRPPTEGGSGTAEVEGAEDRSGTEDEASAGGEQKRTERTDEL